MYAISNPAWPGFIKIGKSVDVFDRLNNYQTSSPLRDYTLIGYAFVLDRHA
ncbi:MAG: GIY-YIG nuclease family protein [Phocaeicola sp.]